MGLVDCIVDIVDIGNMLCVNGLELMELIVIISF